MVVILEEMFVIHSEFVLWFCAFLTRITWKLPLDCDHDFFCSTNLIVRPIWETRILEPAGQGTSRSDRDVRHGWHTGYILHRGQVEHGLCRLSDRKPLVCGVKIGLRVRATRSIRKGLHWRRIVRVVGIIVAVVLFVTTVASGVAADLTEHGSKRRHYGL